MGCDAFCGKLIPLVNLAGLVKMVIPNSGIGAMPNCVSLVCGKLFFSSSLQWVQKMFLVEERSLSPRRSHERDPYRDLHLDLEHLSDLNHRLELKLEAKGKINQVFAPLQNAAGGQNPKKVKQKVPLEAYGIKDVWGLGKKALVWAGFLGGSPPILPAKFPNAKEKLGLAGSGELSPPQEAPAGSRSFAPISPWAGLDPFFASSSVHSNPAVDLCQPDWSSVNKSSSLKTYFSLHGLPCSCPSPRNDT